MNQETNPRADITWHDHAVTPEMRESALGQRGCVIWFTGLSGCGKSTIANVLEGRLVGRVLTTFLLDGDNVRHHLCASPDRLIERHGEAFARRFGLGFDAIDREENIRRIGAVTELFASAGLITLAAFVSPYRRDRDHVRSQVQSVCGPGAFVEVFVDTPLEVCEQRDPKGLYKKARAGEIANFTGISDPYEPPDHPELRLEPVGKSPDELAGEIIAYLELQQVIPKRSA